MPTRTFFASAAPDGTTDLFVSDGTPGGTSRIAVPGAPSAGVQPTDITVVGSTVLFSGTNVGANTTLFAYDTTTGVAAAVTAADGYIGGLFPSRSRPWGPSRCSGARTASATASACSPTTPGPGPRPR